MTVPACMDCDRDAVVFGDTRALCLECAFDRSMLRGDAMKPKRRRRLPYHVAAPTAPPRLGHFLQQKTGEYPE